MFHLPSFFTGVLTCAAFIVMLLVLLDCSNRRYYSRTKRKG